MIRIIDNPHLPEGEVRSIIIGEKYRNLLNKPLNEHKISVICSDNNPFVDERLSGHCDLSVIHVGNKRIAAAEYLKDSELINKAEELGFEVIYVPNPQKTSYPYDAALNFCIIGENIICNPKTAENNLITGKNLIKCNQGYTKCSTLVVDSNSLITSDKLIARNAELCGIETLLIDDSFVSLRGFKKGFIGGASFKISKNRIAFTGTIECIEAKTAIENFLRNRGIEAVYLTKEKIFDIGSAIPIIEEI